MMLTGAAHANSGGFRASASELVPRADHLPSLLYRCAVEAAVLVNPAHTLRVHARTDDAEQFIRNEEQLNPAFKV